MHGSVKILTIEDEAYLREGLVAYLEDLGYKLYEASNGNEGLKCFQHVQPDLVLCDLRLPGLDGLEVLSAISESSPDTPVIIVSGGGQISDVIQALKRGAWDYITKPIVDFGILDTAIQRGLHRAQLIKDNRRYQRNLERLNRDLSGALDQLREDEEAARALQLNMLPEAELQVGDYLFSHRFFPSMLLSGDFVDYFPLGGGETGFYIADVSGHGAASAFVTVMLKTLFEKYRDAYARGEDQTIRHPEQTLARLNQDIYQLPVDKYLTIFYGVLDQQSRRIQFCSGGQFPYPMIERDGQIEAIPHHDKPVGLFEDSDYRLHEIELHQGFRFLMVSDGILELLEKDPARRRTERLLKILNDGDLSIDFLVERLGIDVREEVPDDITFLSVSQRGNDEPG